MVQVTVYTISLLQSTETVSRRYWNNWLPKIDDSMTKATRSGERDREIRQLRNCV